MPNSNYLHDSNALEMNPYNYDFYYCFKAFIISESAGNIKKMIESVFHEIMEHVRQNLSDVCSIQNAGE